MFSVASSKLGSVEANSEIRGTQNITTKASMILPSSPECLGSVKANRTITSTTSREESYCQEPSKWYYLFLRNEELKGYFRLLAGGGETCAPQFRCFAYTSATHNQKKSDKHLNEDDYALQVSRYHKALEALEDGNPAKFNSLTDIDALKGDGYLFVCAPLSELTAILEQQKPVRHLVRNRNTDAPACIPDSEIRDFFILYEILPYNIQILEHQLSQYTVKQKRIRFTGGVFQGREARIMRLHRNTCIAFELSNMTLSMRCSRIFPYEIID